MEYGGRELQKEGAIAGMLTGLAAGTAYLIYVYPKFMGNPAWLGIDHLRFGLIGAPVCLVVMVVVSLMTKALTLLHKEWLMKLGFLAEDLFLVDNTS